MPEKPLNCFQTQRENFLGWRGMRIEIFMKLIKQLLTLIVYTTILCQKCTINPRISTLSKKGLYKTKSRGIPSSQHPVITTPYFQHLLITIYSVVTCKLFMQKMAYHRCMNACFAPVMAWKNEHQTH